MRWIVDDGSTCFRNDELHVKDECKLDHEGYP